MERSGPGEWPRNGHPQHLKQACEGSLQRLRVDRIDLYQLHSPDDDVPYEESVGAMKELQDEGKIRHIGISNVSVEQLEQAREIVDVVSVQNRFNLEDRSSEELLDRCEELGICFFPWFPLAAGRARRSRAASRPRSPRHTGRAPVRSLWPGCCVARR